MCGQAEDGLKTACSWYGAKSIIVIANTISVFPFHVLTLYHESYFTFVKFANLSLNCIQSRSGTKKLADRNCMLEFGRFLH